MTAPPTDASATQLQRAELRRADAIRTQARIQRHETELEDQTQQAFDAALRKAGAAMRQPGADAHAHHATSRHHERPRPTRAPSENDALASPLQAFVPFIESVCGPGTTVVASQAATGCSRASCTMGASSDVDGHVHALPAASHLHIEWNDAALPLHALSLSQQPGQVLQVQLHAKAGSTPAHLSTLRNRLRAHNGQWTVVSTAGHDAAETQ